MRGAYLATAVAEYFRDCGRDVLLMMDSITRLPWPPGSGLGRRRTSDDERIYPIVFAQLPKLLERVGMTSGQAALQGSTPSW